MNKTNKEGVLTISGKDYHVNFGANYFVRYFGEATGKDWLVHKDEILNAVGKDAISNTVAYLYAGHKCYCSLNKIPCDLTYDQADEVIMSIQNEETNKVYNSCIALALGITVEQLNKIIEETVKKIAKEEKRPSAAKKK